MLIISRRKVAGMIVSEGNCREIAVFQLGDLFFLIKGSLGGETSVLRTFRMSGK